MSAPRGDGPIPPGITPEEEAAVSDWLAQGAGPLLLPDEVATRLDGVLADLVAERPGLAGAPDPSERHDADESAELAQRRRWPRLLLAAAAVLVVGYGVASVTGDGSLSGGQVQVDSGSSASKVEAGDTADGVGGQSTPGGSAAGSAGADSSGSAYSADKGLRSPAEDRPTASAAPSREPSLGRFPPRLRSERLDVGVRRALRYIGADATGGLLIDDVEGAQCETPDLAPGERFLPVLYNGDPAGLVARPADRGRVEVTVYSCGGSEIDHTTVTP